MKTSTKIDRNDLCPCNIHLSWVDDDVKVEIGAGKKYKKCCGFNPNFKDTNADFALGQELVRQHNEELKSKLSHEQYVVVSTPPVEKKFKGSALPLLGMTMLATAWPSHLRHN